MQQAATHVIERGEWHLQCFENLRLEPRLLMQPDHQIGEQHQLRAGHRVGRFQCGRVVRERPPKIVLAFGRVTRSQAGQKHGQFIGGDHSVPAERQEARELARDFFIDLAIATGDGIAGARQRPGCHDPERSCAFRLRMFHRVDEDTAPQSVDPVDEPGLAPQAPLDHIKHILAADGLPRLPRRPHGERAPVRPPAGTGRKTHREAVIVIRDPEIAKDRV